MSGPLLMREGTIVKIIGKAEYISFVTGKYVKITKVIKETKALCPYRVVTKSGGREFCFWTYEEELQQITDPAEIEYAKIMSGGL